MINVDLKVNIAGFGSTYEELFSSRRKYDQVVLNNAKAYVERKYKKFYHFH